jgi:type IV secretory pathway VirB2 component (pilin)
MDQNLEQSVQRRNREGSNMNKKAMMDIMGFIVKFLVFTMIVAAPAVQAVDLDTEITAEEQEQFDEILTPVMKIYNFIKYTASVIAVIALLFAGISYMMSGDDIRKREASKNTAAYVIIGLAIIWAAPMVVNVMIA